MYFFHNLARQTERFLNPFRFISRGGPRGKSVRAAEAELAGRLDKLFLCDVQADEIPRVKTGVMLPGDTSSKSEHVSLTLDKHKYSYTIVGVFL